MSAGPASLNQEFHGLAQALLEVIERARPGGLGHIAGGDLARLLTGLVKVYAAKAESEGTASPPISADKVTPTEVVLIVSEMLRAVNISLFDLAMWYRRGQGA